MIPPFSRPNRIPQTDRPDADGGVSGTSPALELPRTAALPVAARDTFTAVPPRRRLVELQPPPPVGAAMASAPQIDPQKIGVVLNDHPNNLPSAAELQALGATSVRVTLSHEPAGPPGAPAGPAASRTARAAARTAPPESS